MRISYSLGSLLSIPEVLACTERLTKFNVDTVWIPETWGMENFAIQSAISQRLTRSKIGSSIINIYSRSPAVIGMGATTIDSLSNGRFVLGLGTSSVPIVENFHGVKFEKPLTRMREYVEVIRLVTSGKKIDYTGQFFHLKNFRLLIQPVREKIPIYLAAVNEKMTKLAWEISDGVIFYLRPINELKQIIEKMQSKRKIDVTCQIITCVSEDSEKAIERTKKTLAFYISVGKIYREFLAKNGFKNDVNNIFEEYKKTGLKSNYELVTQDLLKELTICGTPEDCKKQLIRFRNTGIDLPIIQFNPVGKTIESFNEFTKTFSEENE